MKAIKYLLCLAIPALTFWSCQDDRIVTVVERSPFPVGEYEGTLHNLVIDSTVDSAETSHLCEISFAETGDWLLSLHAESASVSCDVIGEYEVRENGFWMVYIDSNFTRGTCDRGLVLPSGLMEVDTIGDSLILSREYFIDWSKKTYCCWLRLAQT